MFVIKYFQLFIHEAHSISKIRCNLIHHSRKIELFLNNNLFIVIFQIYYLLFQPFNKKKYFYNFIKIIQFNLFFLYFYKFIFITIGKVIDNLPLYKFQCKSMGNHLRIHSYKHPSHYLYFSVLDKIVLNPTGDHPS